MPRSIASLQLLRAGSLVRGADSLPRGQLLGRRLSYVKSFRPKQLQLWRRQGRCIRSGRLNQDVRGGACSLVPRQCVRSEASVEDMAQWDADRYSQLSDNDHHTIVGTRLVARVLPGFECRSGVRGHFVGRCLSHELGNDSRLGPPSSDCTSYFAWKQSGTARHLLQSRFCVDFLLRNSAVSLVSCSICQRTSPYVRRKRGDAL